MIRAPVALLTGLFLIGCSSGSSGAPLVAAETATPTTRPTATERPTARPTPRPTATPVARDDLVIVEQGFTLGVASDTSWAQVGVVVENPNSSTHVARFVSVQLTFYDADFRLAGSGEELITAVLPGQRAALGTSIFDVENAVEMEVVIRTDWMEIDFAPGEFTFDQVTTEREQFGGWQTQGLILSTFEAEQESVHVVAIYKDAAGAVLGGEFTFVDFVPAGGQSPFEMSTFSQFDVEVATTEMYAMVRP